MSDASVPQSPPAAPALPTATGASRIAFTGSRAEFRRLVMRGAFFELLTLGFYRFWLATDIRRHLWSNSSVDRDALEYTGTAKELFIGFLFALAILVPIYLAYFFLTFEAERIQAFASIPLGLFFYLFYQFAMYRARRYRLSRTIWRGVRFWMTGSGWSYAWRAGLWVLLVIVTLGLALPWYQAALERYKMRHSHFGDLAGRFDGTGWQFFKRGAWIWFLALFIYVLIIFCAVLIAAGPRMFSGLGETPARVIGITGIVLLVLLSIVGSPFAWAAYKAIEWRWWVSGIRFGDVRFESTLSMGALSGLYWAVIGWSLLILTALSALGGAVLQIALQGAVAKGPEAIALAMQQPLILVALVAAYLIAALAFGVIVRLYLRRDVWARVAEATMVHNLEAAANVAARGDAVNALGEGFADSLDIGGF